MKKYTTISFLLIVLIGLFTYINTNSQTTFNLIGIDITLPNAVWVSIFLFIFYLISIIYFSIEKYKNFKFSRQVKKDRDNLLENAKNKIFFKDKILPVKELVKLETIIEMIEGDRLVFKESDLDYINDLAKIQQGEVIELKKYKLDKDNPWVLRNLENRLNKEDIEAAKEALNTPLKEKALEILSKHASVKEILANNYPITKETILNNLDSHRLKELIDKSNLTNQEYIEIAQVLYKQTQVPEKLLELFSNKIVPYIYLLIEYEMIDEAKEKAKEYDVKIFEYYLLLREHGEKIDIKEYLNAKL